MDDEQVWLEEAEYAAAPVHRLRKAPIAAAIAAAATLALVMAMPRSWIERAVYELYVDTLIPAARLPLGDMSHAVVAFVTAAVVALIAFAVARFFDFGRLLDRRDEPISTLSATDAGEPRLRRADSHPDAPPRAPFRFDPDFDADNTDHEDYAAECADDPAAMTEDDADDALFDLGGFEAVDEPTDGTDDPAIWDVSARAMPDATPDAEPLVSREVAGDSIADVREKFADMFGPGEGPENDSDRAGRSKLANLTTGQLIDELERRVAARSRNGSADRVAPARFDEAVEAGAGPPTEPPTEPTPQRQADHAANGQVAVDAVHYDADDDQRNGGDFEDMDAALQAALGTLARMQQRSAG